MTSLAVQIERRNWRAVERVVDRQRAARLAKEATDAAREVEHGHRCSAPVFWDNVDTSGGPDACHLWTGETKFNHPEGTNSRFEQGKFTYEGCESWISTRVLCYATFGREVPRDLDVTPLCGDHLCCNVKHLCITPHGGGDRLGRAVTVEEFFCAA